MLVLVKGQWSRTTFTSSRHYWPVIMMIALLTLMLSNVTTSVVASSRRTGVHGILIKSGGSSTIRHSQRLSFAEIGAMMNRSPDAARKLWSRAIVHLQKAMDEPDG